MANDIIVSEMTSATQINTNDLMIMTQPDLQAETGYSTKKGTVLQVANKMLKGTEYLTDLPDFTDKTVLGGLEELKGDLTALLPVDTASGAIANFDTDLSLPLVDCKASIVASQPSGTPTPSSPLAISGYTGVNLTRCGVNLWDEDWEVGNIDNATGENSIATNCIRTAGYIPVGGSLSIHIVSPSNSTGVYAVFEYDFNNAYIGYTMFNNMTGGNFTTNASTRFLRFRNYVAYGTTYNNDISINYPSTDTSYHAYNGTTYAVSWQTEAGTVYGGNIDLTTGVLTVTKKGKLANGTENWYSYTSSSNTITYALANAVSDILNENNQISDMFAYNANAYDATRNLPNTFVLGSSKTLFVQVSISDYPDSTSFKTFLSNNNLLVVYNCTPFTYQLTPVQVQALIGVNNIYNDTNGDTEVKYKEGIQHYIDKKIAATQALIL